ncbi:MAG: VOC family protein [Pseudomonadota bacterium]
MGRIVRVVVILGLGAVVSACALQSAGVPVQAASVADAMPHLKRPNLVVVDIERSLRIYRDILGFEASAIRIGGADSYSYPVFNVPASATLRFVSLDEPREARVLNLTEVTGAAIPRPSQSPHTSAVVIGITDLAQRFERLAELGLETTEPKVADGVDFRFVEQAFVDYDGHLIVCYEVINEQ